jgi:hypothetical protein
MHGRIAIVINEAAQVGLAGRGSLLGAVASVSAATT